MSTSDQQGHGPLTRKQLREIRLTGSTPVITPEEAAAAAAAAPVAPPLPSEPAPVEAEPASLPDPEDAVAADDEDHRVETQGEPGSAPLTRRQVRELERSRTGSVPTGGAAENEEAPVEDVAVADVAVDEAAVDADQTDVTAEADHAELVAVVEPLPEASGLVTAVPAFAPLVPSDDIDDADDDLDDEIAATPVSASASVDNAGEVPLVPGAFVPASEESAAEVQAEPATDDDAVAAVAALGIEVETPEEHEADDADDVLADVDHADDSDIAEDERPTVNPAFGQAILSDAPEAQKPFVPSFDELLTVGDSTGSQHLAPNTLIFTPSPGDGSLSGPVASTGEILVTGSYELPKGLGSQGHAHGTTDGKDVDAVLIDGELPPASSPTPIAASAAVSTIKPAGEVIRPPAPDKGNKLMLILAIVAGGLALALGVALIVAFTTNVL